MGNTSNITTVDTMKVNWNKLTLGEFMKVESEYQLSGKLIDNKSIKDMIIVEIFGNKYQVTSTIYNRIKACKNNDTRLKMMNDVTITHSPLEEL
jgi:hypothetical protein